MSWIRRVAAALLTLIILAATVFSVFLTAFSIRKVNSNEINSLE